jgi:hypothetical protein
MGVGSKTLKPLGWVGGGLIFKKPIKIYRMLSITHFGGMVFENGVLEKLTY